MDGSLCKKKKKNPNWTSKNQLLHWYMYIFMYKKIQQKVITCNQNMLVMYINQGYSYIQCTDVDGRWFSFGK